MKNIAGAVVPRLAYSLPPALESSLESGRGLESSRCLASGRGLGSGRWIRPLDLAVALDLAVGSGRWIRLLDPAVALDPALAVNTCRRRRKCSYRSAVLLHGTDCRTITKRYVMIYILPI